MIYPKDCFPITIPPENNPSERCQPERGEGPLRTDRESPHSSQKEWLKSYVIQKYLLTDIYFILSIARGHLKRIPLGKKGDEIREVFVTKILGLMVNEILNHMR